MRLFNACVKLCFRHKSLRVPNYVRAVSTNALVETKHLELEDCRFPEQIVTIQTCGKLYEEWQKVYKFWKIPEGNLTFNVRYVDTSFSANNREQPNAISNTSPVVLALHGTPGSYKDFHLLISHLYGHGIRVISPSFPDFSDYKPGVFRHSALERTQFIKDFLKAINVSYIDLVICHSAAVYPSLKLCNENLKPRISGLAMLNPMSISTKMRSTSPFWFYKCMAKISEFPVGLQTLEAIGPALLKLAKTPVHFESIYGPLSSIFATVHGDIPETKDLLHNLHLQKFPIFYAFSENDKMIQTVLQYKMAYILGIQDDGIFYVDKEGILHKRGKILKNTKVMSFKGGSHYCFWKHPNIVNDSIVDFLENQVL